MNARDAMPAGGMLEVRTAAHNGSVEVEVTDTGIGIPPEHLHRIFDPFFTTKATGKGTGLGLSVSYGIIKEHAGKVDVRSTPARARRSGWNSPPPGKQSMPRGSILVVDDEAEIREGLEALLTSENFDVTLAETGEAGLQRLEEQPFDLMLLDVSLPDRNGLEMLREIRRRDPHLSIILITAYGSIDMARAAFKSGAQDYITKPWSNDELIAQISLAIEGRRLREENVQLKRALKQRYNFPNIVGKSEKMLAVLDLVTQVAPSRSTVLISGESGTGKELIAKAIHAASPRADKAFIPINTRLDSRGPAGVAAFRPREGRVHQRHRLEEGAVRSGRPRHDLFRRNLDGQPRNASQAAARDSGARVHAAGRHRDDQGGRAHPGRFQRRLEASSWRRPLPRGFVSPPERDLDSVAAAARAQRRHPAAGRAFPRPILPRERQAAMRHSRTRR